MSMNADARLSELSNPLSAVLEEDVLLRKVLGYLVDDGLYECRRVCHKWLKVCDRLPLKLCNIRPQDLPALNKRFPNAASISLREMSPDNVSQESLEFVEAFRSLENLSFDVAEVVAPATRVMSLARMTRLTSLSLSSSVSDPLSDVYDSLRFLTKLTFLQISDSPPVVQVDPFIELLSIQEMRLLGFPWKNSEGLNLFPSLTGLTRLVFDVDYGATEDVTQNMLEVCVPKLFRFF